LRRVASRDAVDVAIGLHGNLVLQREPPPDVLTVDAQDAGDDAITIAQGSQLFDANRKTRTAERPDGSDPMRTRRLSGHSESSAG
jgi:hypothetical protein